ncbi:cysteine synthase CysK domain protein [Mycobacterium xenopi 3993]|nr:cysteine synthase CysK domain protein [Mycobacterium xenopi 3993]
MAGRSRPCRCIDAADPCRGSQPPTRLDRQRDPADRGRRPSQRRHPSAALAWAGDVDVALYLKDETTHISGGHKRRLARSLLGRSSP